jgi:SSS family solute:Na+ symporter
MNIHSIDLVVIIVYLLAITAIGIYIGYQKNTTSRQYFLAGKSLGWFTIGSSLFASNISTIHLVGLAAAGANIGLVMGNFEWMASFCLIALGLFFAPYYFKSKIETLPQFLEKRYSPAARTFLAAIAIFGALLIHIGISLFAGAKLFEAFLGIPVLWSILIVSAITVLYTILGGLKAVVVTETIQTFLLLGGAVLITVLGINALPDAGINSYAEFKAQVSPDHLSLIHPLKDSEGHLNGYSWLAILLGYPVLGIWYWCSDQTIVQRVLGARTLADAQNGALFAGFLKILPLFLMVFPGVIGIVLFQKGVITIPQLDNGQLDYNATLAQLINTLVPTGLKGLLAAGLLAALMSTIAAALNSCATIISVDIVKRIRPDITDRKEVKIGRISAGIIMVLAMLWSTQGDQFGTIFEAINKIPMIFAPAVTVVLLLGVFWKRGTNQAALATFAVGCTIGLIYFIMDMPVVGRALLDNPTDGFQGLITDPNHGIGIPFMLVGPMICALCFLIYIVTSLRTPQMDPARLADVCWDHPLDILRKGEFRGIGDPRSIAGILLVLMIILYIIMG